MDEAEKTNGEVESGPEFCGFPSLEEFSKNGMKLIMEATKSINALPSGSSRDLYSAHTSFSKVMEAQSEQILSVISNVLKLQCIKGNIVRRDKEEKFELLQECNDAMLERINSNLDDLAGLKKSTSAVLVTTEIKTTPLPQKYGIGADWGNKSISSPQTAKLLTAKNIARPQINFKTPVDNTNGVPFCPRIKDKPNSIKPLAVLPEYDDDRNIVSYIHPYDIEIEKFEPSAEQMMKKEPQIPIEMEKVPHNFVETTAQLKSMMNDFANVKELAIDLEHHSYRTFQGITCLMQISSREKDYIIDTIKLRDELHILNEVFTNPKVVKVFHGADSDIEWLQRDLSLYIVNMFDTHQASRRLEFARLSLAFLLKHYCQIDADKTFQLADWRMRPLPEQLLQYAQQDTHYLLYIYDMLTNDLLNLGNGQTNILKSVYQSSKLICLKRYIKTMMTEDTHKDLYLKSKRIFDNRQMFALKEIYAWRDKIARLEDESYGYVLPNHMLLQIAESLPREMQGILACCNPIPPIVRQHLNVIHQVILKAREQPLIKPMINEEINRPTVNLNNKSDVFNNPLYCPHDLNHCKEERDDLPTILGSVRLMNDYSSIKVPEVKLSVFNKTSTGYQRENGLKELKFISPYDRYKLMIPYLEEMKKKEQAEEEEKRKQLLEEKKRALPVVQIVKAVDEDLYNLPLKELKKRKPNDVEENGENPSGSQIIPLKQSKKRKLEQLVKEEEEVLEVSDDESIIMSSPEQSPARTPKSHKKKFKNKPIKSSDVRQNSNKPIEFDYSQVNYHQRFQGGSTSKTNGKQNNKQFNQKFKGGGKKAMEHTKKLDKMFSFSNVRVNKHSK